MDRQYKYETLIADRLRESASLKESLAADEVYRRTVSLVASEIVRAFESGHRLLLFGNGGSAGDAQHIAAEFSGRFLLERQPWPAISLVSNICAITAIGNDYGFDCVFARQIEALGQPGDIAFGISTSGNSPNVVRALEVARQKGLLTVGLSGFGGQAMHSFTDHSICIPSAATPRIQEAHIMTGHIICELVELSITMTKTLAAHASR